MCRSCCAFGTAPDARSAGASCVAVQDKATADAMARSKQLAGKAVDPESDAGSPVVDAHEVKADTETKDVESDTPSATTQPGQQQPVATGPSVQDGKPGKVRGNAGAVRGRNPEPAAGDVGRGSAKNAGTDYVPSPRGLTRTAHGSRLPSAILT